MTDEFVDAITRIFKVYKDSLADGKLTWHEIMTLMCNGSTTFTRLIEQMNPENGQGAVKKELALATLGQFYDSVIAPIDIKGVPNFVEPMVDSALRSLAISVGSAAIDSTVALFNRLGWGSEPMSVTEAAIEASDAVHFQVIGV